MLTPLEWEKAKKKKELVEALTLRQLLERQMVLRTYLSEIFMDLQIVIELSGYRTNRHQKSQQR